MGFGSEHQRRGSVGRRSFLKALGLFAAVPAVSRRLTGAAPAATAPADTAGLTSLPTVPSTRTVGQAPGQDSARWEACLRAARAMLLVGPGGEDLKLQYLKILIDDGLPKTRRPRDVLIVGAGIAGLAAGLLLKQAGHHVTIIEANGNRIGGRIKTFHSDPEQDVAPFADKAQYAEAGAMRIPDIHPLTLALIDKLGLSRRLFYNVDVTTGTGKEDARVPAVTYQSFDGSLWRRGPGKTAFRAPDHASHTWISTNDQQARRSEYSADPTLISSGFQLPGGEAGHVTGDLLNTALDPARDYFSDVTPGGRVNKQPVEAWVEGWARLIYDLDHCSMWGFLSQQAGLSDQTIEAIGTLENLTSRMPLSFIHSFQELATINPH